jgi:hypothetical protein
MAPHVVQRRSVCRAGSARARVEAKIIRDNRYGSIWSVITSRGDNLARGDVCAMYALALNTRSDPEWLFGDGGGIFGFEPRARLRARRVLGCAVRRVECALRG